jgi:hypothetical protein
VKSSVELVGLPSVSGLSNLVMADNWCHSLTGFFDSTIREFGRSLRYRREYRDLVVSSRRSKRIMERVNVS